MIYHRNKEILLNHLDSEVYAGIHLGKYFYISNRYFDLGRGRQWDLSALLPNIYQKLSIDNVFLLSARNVSGGASIVVTQTGYDVGYLSISVGISRSYDERTGILKMNVYCNNGKADVTPVIITKPEKLIHIGNGQIFDIKSMFPTTYQNFNVNNFLIKSYKAGLVHNDFRGSEGSWNASCTQTLYKSYEDGVLTCYMKESVQDNYTGYKTLNRDCDIYLYKGRAV